MAWVLGAGILGEDSPTKSNTDFSPKILILCTYKKERNCS
jgi:hypothetical protein